MTGDTDLVIFLKDIRHKGNRSKVTIRLVRPPCLLDLGLIHSNDGQAGGFIYTVEAVIPPSVDFARVWVTNTSMTTAR